MRKTTALISTASFFLIFSLVVIGIGLIMFGYSAELRMDFSLWLEQHHIQLIWIGGALLGFCALLLKLFYAAESYRYLEYKMGPHRAEVELKAIQQLLHQFWHERYPQEKFAFDVSLLPKQTLSVLIFPQDPRFTPNGKMVKQIERNIGQVLAEKLHYRKRFSVTIVQ